MILSLFEMLKNGMFIAEPTIRKFSKTRESFGGPKWNGDIGRSMAGQHKTGTVALFERRLAPHPDDPLHTRCPAVLLPSYELF
jgi:hypothetical protein